MQRSSLFTRSDSPTSRRGVSPINHEKLYEYLDSYFEIYWIPNIDRLVESDPISLRELLNELPTLTADELREILTKMYGDNPDDNLEARAIINVIHRSLTATLKDEDSLLSSMTKAFPNASRMKLMEFISTHMRDRTNDYLSHHEKSRDPKTLKRTLSSHL